MWSSSMHGMVSVRCSILLLPAQFVSVSIVDELDIAQRKQSLLVARLNNVSF